MFCIIPTIQALEKLNKIDHRNIQTQTEKLHYKVREEQPKGFKQRTLIYPVYLQDLPNDRSSVKANWTPVAMLDLRRFKEVIVSYGMHSPLSSRC